MRKFITFSLLIVFSYVAILEAREHEVTTGVPFVKQWISAMMGGGEGLNSIITPDFEYTQYSFEFKDRLWRGKRGDIPFFAKKSKPTEIDVEEVRHVAGGQLAILSAVAESGLYRAWEIRLYVEPNGVAKVSEIAKEGTFEGYPPGCPETAFKRDLVVTLHGSPEGFSGPREVKLFTFRRDTDSLDYAQPGADEKMLKHCSPKPDTYLIESEVVVIDEHGQIEASSTVAAKHKAEGQQEAFGATFFEEDGLNFPGRLFNLGNGKEGMLLTFLIERSQGEKEERLGPAKLFVWRGGGWKSIWSFDAAYSPSAGSLGRSNQIEWSLTSGSDGSGLPAIIVELETNSDDGFRCPEGTLITFVRAGSGFKAAKGTPSTCLRKHGVSDASLKANVKEDKGPVYHGKVKEIDWVFQK